MSEQYDSRPATLEHIKRVQELLASVVRELVGRAEFHDMSKLEEPEKSGFDEWTPKLRSLTYGSKEYEEARAGLGEALAHHYANNRHHPEHHRDGIRGMTLVDLMEMFCDWKAATERHADGDIRKSIPINAERFGISEDLAKILHNTADAMGW